MRKKENKKRMIFGIALLFAIILVSTIWAVSFSSPQIGAPGGNSFSYLQRQGINAASVFNENQCEAGQDFIVQIAPFGCTPAVVRSDLLEEQNVPVFCQLYATKINPLIDVEAVDFISFDGEYPNEIAGVGFHPASAAIKSSSTTLLNNPVLQNIGYAVIVLKQNPNESSMPDFVSGNLTANIRYDIQNAFGVGGVSRYIPETSDEEWNENYVQYGFWDGKGYLRVEGVETEGATVSIYSDRDNKISSFNLAKGETSGPVSLPGFYCQASLNVRVDEIRSPDTRAIFNINGEIYEVAEGERFLDNNCVVRNVEKKGLVQKAEVGCRTDDGFETFNFEIAPKMKISIDGVERDVKLGERIFTTADNEKSVYLAYIGTDRNTRDKEDLFVYFIAAPMHKESLSEDEIDSASFIARAMENSGTSGERGAATLNRLTQKYVGWANRFANYFLFGDNWDDLRFSDPTEDIFGKSITLGGFSQGANAEFLDTATKEYYDNAMSDYREVLQNFANEKRDNSKETLGVEALRKSIDTAIDSNQFQTASDLCDEFEEKYPNDARTVKSACGQVKISSEGVLVEGAVMNGRAKTIFLEGISEPSYDDFSAEISVRKSNGNGELISLTKNEIVTLNENPEFVYTIGLEKTIFVSNEFSLGQISLGFFNEKWLWSADITGNKNWMDIGETTVRRSNGASFIGKTLSKEDAAFLEQLRGKTLAQGEPIIMSRIVERGFVKINPKKEVNQEGNDFIQLLDLTQDSARVKLHLRDGSIDSEIVMKTDTNEQYGSYIFAIERINLKNVARVSVVPSIRNTGTEANFSFNIGIEKRLIQLSPDKIKERVEQLNESIEKWEDTSEKVGEVVKGFNAACLAVGTGLTIKNLFQNFDGRAIARQEVMRSSGGWFDICKDAANRGEYGGSVDNCLLENDEKIESDVSLVEGIINAEENSIDNSNAKDRLPQIQSSLGGSFQDPDAKGPAINTASDSDVGKAISPLGLSEGKISLSQARDIQRLKGISSTQGISDEVKKAADRKLYGILSDIQANSNNFRTYASVQSELGEKGFGDIGVNSYGGVDSIEGIYSGGQLSPSQIKGVSGLETSKKYPTEVVIYNNEKYVLLLEEGNSNQYHISEVYKYGGIAAGVMAFNPATDAEKTNVKSRFSKFTKYDRTTYENNFKDPQVRYFETSPYNGLPAIVPFDTDNGWYVGTKQTLSGFGNIRAYDESGQIRSFYICNVGKNGREEFYSDLKDDICRNFNPGLQQVQGQFPGLDVGETQRLVSNALEAVEDAARQHSQGVKRVSILGEFTEVGTPSLGTPDIQCQDFMSAKECNVLFNACDPVVCPSSRCNLGGAYTVPDVIQSGIIGSAALCLPNAKENIVVPVCLSGIKAGIDGFVSVQKNYRDCLQTNLETGETIGICDEIHSIYLCDFFWSQAQPVAGVIVPKIFEVIRGQTGRGGGEYLGVASSWENAQRSVDYMTNYYGAASFEAFKTGVINQVGHAVCRNFVSASYPDTNFLDSLIEPESPPQYTAWFSESPYTTSTVPPTSRYKVFYHIFAGEGEIQTNGIRNSGVFYRVYLKTPQTGSFFNAAQTVQIADGFIPPGEIASETRDFTFPSGYQELCINVNGQEECGFNRVSTDFGLDYLQDLTRAEQGEQTDIDSESECVSGTPSLYSLVNPNLQDAAQDLVDPNLYAQQIVRVCSTDNPGRGTDAKADGEGSRWVQVGTCDANGNLKCYLDQDSVRKAITSTDIENATLKTTSDNFANQIQIEGQYFEDFDGEFKKLSALKDDEKIRTITIDFIAKAFYNAQKARLIMLRGDAYKALVEGKIKATAAQQSSGAATGTASGSGTSGNTNVVEFVFEDESYTPDKNIIYRFSNKWEYWYTTGQGTSEWRGVDDFDYLGHDFYDTTAREISNKLKGTTYEQGVKSLIDALDKDGEILSTRFISLNYEKKIFRVRQDARSNVLFYVRLQNGKWEWTHNQETPVSPTDSKKKWYTSSAPTQIAGDPLTVSDNQKKTINSLSGIPKDFNGGAAAIFKTDGETVPSSDVVKRSPNLSV